MVELLSNCRVKPKTNQLHCTLFWWTPQPKKYPLLWRKLFPRYIQIVIPTSLQINRQIRRFYLRTSFESIYMHFGNISNVFLSRRGNVGLKNSADVPDYQIPFHMLPHSLRLWKRKNMFHSNMQIYRNFLWKALKFLTANTAPHPLAPPYKQCVNVQNRRGNARLYCIQCYEATPV